MDLTLLVFFVLPLATILLAIVLQKLLKSPILVAITFFAIYLIVAFVSFSDNLAVAIIAVLVYTLIAYITAYVVMTICRIRRRFCEEGSDQNASVSTINDMRMTNQLNDTVMCENMPRSGENMTRRIYRRF